MTVQSPRLPVVWKLAIVVTIGVVMFGIIAIGSMFREPPGFNPVFLILKLFLIYLCFESIVQFQQRVWTKKLNNVLIFLGSVVFGTTVYTVLFYFYKWLDHLVLHSEVPMLQHMVFAAFIGLAISAIISLILIASNWKNQYYLSQLENEEFKREIVKANLAILKNQLDPHFMFNNFNTLYYLIDENTTLARQFLENISSVYRYILQYNDQALIPISQEYQMVKQYLGLLELRYKSALSIDIDVDAEMLKQKNVPPLVLQQLVENAIKHNRIDEHYPLTIGFEVSEDYFTIKNNTNPKRLSKTTGTGLDNIKKRYGFLSNQKVIIIEKAREFEVSIPLLKSEQ